MNNNSSKQVLLSVIGVAILVVAVVGVSFAFFYYARVSNLNEVTTGNITFSAEYGEFTAMKNVWPTTSLTDEANVATATITISGETSYEEGIKYTVFAEAVDNSLVVPVTLTYQPEAETGFTGTTTTLANGALGTGTIAAGTAVNADIVIKAHVDASKVLITDTPDLVPESVKNGRTIISTTDWNNKALSFKIRVVATQGDSSIDHSAR